MLLGMFGFGTTEVIVVLIVAVLLFGPSQIPRLAKSLGQTIKEFRRAGDEITGAGEELQRETRELNRELNS